MGRGISGARDGCKAGGAGPLHPRVCARNSLLFQLAAAHPCRDGAAQPHADAVSGEDAGDAADVAFLHRRSLRRLGLLYLGRQFGGLMSRRRGRSGPRPPRRRRTAGSSKNSVATHSRVMTRRGSGCNACGSGRVPAKGIGGREEGSGATNDYDVRCRTAPVGAGLAGHRRRGAGRRRVSGLRLPGSRRSRRRSPAPGGWPCCAGRSLTGLIPSRSSSWTSRPLPCLRSRATTGSDSGNCRGPGSTSSASTCLRPQSR